MEPNGRCSECRYLPTTEKAVVVGRKLSKDQRRLLEDLATSLPPEPAEPQPVGQGEDDKGLFDRVKDIFG